jgi:type II secretory pathway pseudopilin PulG
MNSQLFLVQRLQHPRLKDAGFSYVEAVVALIFTLILLAATGPLFWNQRERNTNSQIRTGAAAVAQRVLEQQRLAFRPGLALPGTNVNLNPPNQTMMGHTYQINVQIREFAGQNANGTLNCTTVPDANSRARCVRVEVRNASNVVVYDVQTVFTQLGPL